MHQGNKTLADGAELTIHPRRWSHSNQANHENEDGISARSFKKICRHKYGTEWQQSQSLKESSTEQTIYSLAYPRKIIALVSLKLRQKLKVFEDRSRTNNTRLVNSPTCTVDYGPTGYFQKSLHNWTSELKEYHSTSLRIDGAHQMIYNNTFRSCFFRPLRYINCPGGWSISKTSVSCRSLPNTAPRVLEEQQEYREIHF